VAGKRQRLKGARGSLGPGGGEARAWLSGAEAKLKRHGRWGTSGMPMPPITHPPAKHAKHPAHLLSLSSVS
jgi:hypothetical protein